MLNPWLFKHMFFKQRFSPLQKSNLFITEKRFHSIPPKGEVNVVMACDVTSKVSSKTTNSISPYKVVHKKILDKLPWMESPRLPISTWQQYQQIPDISSCPHGFPIAEFKKFCAMGATLDCWLVSMPHESWIPLLQGCYFSKGIGVALVQQMLASTDFFTTTIPEEMQDKLVGHSILLNSCKFLPRDLLANLPDFFLANLSRISIKTQPTLFYEAWAVFQVNSHLVHNRLGFAFDTSALWEKFLFRLRDPFPYEKGFSSDATNYVNLTQNRHPDFVLVLDEPVTVTTLPPKTKTIITAVGTYPRNLVAFDLKFGPLSPSRNIVKGCENEIQLATELRRMHNALLYYLTNKNFPHNYKINESIVTELKKNLSDYSQTHDVNAFQANYHGIYDRYTKFFLENNVGFNFIINLSICELRIPQDHVTFFTNKFRTHYAKPGFVSHFAAKIAGENPTVIAANDHIKSFIAEYLTNRS